MLFYSSNQIKKEKIFRDKKRKKKMEELIVKVRNNAVA